MYLRMLWHSIAYLCHKRNVISGTLWYNRNTIHNIKNVVTSPFEHSGALIWLFWAEQVNTTIITVDGLTSCVVWVSVDTHNGVIKWKHFPLNWPFARGIQRSPVNSPHKGQWRGVLMFSLICAWIHDWVNNREAGDLRCNNVLYDVIVKDNGYGE